MLEKVTYEIHFWDCVVSNTTHVIGVWKCMTNDNADVCVFYVHICVSFITCLLMDLSNTGLYLASYSAVAATTEEIYVCHAYRLIHYRLRFYCGLYYLLCSPALFYNCVIYRTFRGFIMHLSLILHVLSETDHTVACMWQYRKMKITSSHLY